MSKLISKELRANLCDEFLEKIEGQDDDFVVEMYKQYCGTAFDEKSISADYILSVCSQEEAEKYGVFAKIKGGDVRELIGGKYVVNECSDMSFTAHGFSVSNITIGAGSTVDIEAFDNAIVFVFAYDTSEVNIITDGFARVSVRQYGDSVIIAQGQVTIKK